MSALDGDSAGLMDLWPVRLMFNLMGYATIIVPGYFIIQYYKNRDLSVKPFRFSCMDRALRACVLGGDGSYSPLPLSAAGPSSDSAAAAGGGNYLETASTGVRLVVCVLGLLGSYLMWGIIQEKVMTRTYSYGESVAKFTDSQFLVFVNRVFALLLSSGYLLLAGQNRRHRAPLYKYSYSSFSNIMSSWCQYEALKFVSFPTQVLAKACKIIPVMLMGKLVSNNKYDYYEYIVALLISLGMTLFLLGTSEGKHDSSTTWSGVLILVGYMMFDSFTSNWQNALYKEYSMSSVQMMCGVNLFSCLFTFISLLQQGTLFTSIAFMMQYPGFMFDCLLLSTFSALGQMFIFYTIAQFGAVVFTIIMTVRQGLAILLSCLLYAHPVSVTGMLGVLVVFSAIFLRIYCSVRVKQRQQQQKKLSGSGPSAQQVV